MRGRTKVTWAATVVLVVGCGGGGGGGSAGIAAPVAPAASTLAAASLPPVPSPPVTAAANVPPAPTTRSIALWGDSMLPGVARAYRYVASDRAVHDGGYPGETSMQVLGHQRETSDYRDWITVFWYGHNNVRLDASAAPAQVVRDMAASVALLTPGNNRFVVMSLVNNADEARAGSPQYATVMEINRQLAAAYPNNYLDIRSFMVGRYDPSNPQQVADFQADVPSTQVREPGDPIHLSGAGSEIVGRRLLEFIASKGW